MRILVTGSRGTIGRPLVEALKARGHTVFGLGRPQHFEDKYYRCDIREFRQLQRCLEWMNVDLVYHLASEFGRDNSREHYEQVWQTNVIGTRHLLELQRHYGFRVFFMSSSEVYGDLPYPVLKEDTTPAPQTNDYALSKWVSELQCQEFIKRYGSLIMIGRLFSAYGPREYYTPYRSLVCRMVYHALHHQPYKVYRDYLRTYLYLDDLIDTLERIPERFVSGEVVNIAGSEYLAVEEVNQLVLKACKRSDELVQYISPTVHGVTSKRPDLNKARELLKHNPKVNIKEGIKRTVAWMGTTYATS